MYSLNDIALMTGLTSRTVRNYIKRGILHGEKRNGEWLFDEKDYAAFLADKLVKRSLRARRNGDVLDFLAEKAAGSRACVILDRVVSDEESDEIVRYFCSSAQDGGVRFTYERDDRISRVILTGEERRVAEIMAGYYGRRNGGDGHDA